MREQVVRGPVKFWIEKMDNGYYNASYGSISQIGKNKSLLIKSFSKKLIGIKTGLAK